MARRGVGNFVAARVGLVHDPKTLGIARALRISRLEAAMTILLWEEFILEHGEVARRGRNKGQGIVRGYSASEVAEGLLWPRERRARLVLDALRAAKMMRCRRGSFVHPYWAETITGEYQLRREEQLEADRARQRRRRSGGQPADVTRTSARHPPDVRSGSGDQSTKASGGRAAGPPQGAPRRGAADRASRWEWFETTYPIGVEDPEGCARALAALPDRDWEHLQFALPTQAKSNRWKHTPWRVPPASRYLKRHEWRRIKWTPGQKPPVTILKVVPIEPEKKPDAAELERQRQVWAKLTQIRARLRDTGLRGQALEDAIKAEMDKEAS